MRALTLLVSPFAPHLGEELWRLQGHEQSLAYEPWPTWDEALCVDDVVEMAVQVNGKVRGRVTLPRAAGEDDGARRGARRGGRRRPHRGQAGEEVHLRPGQDHQPRGLIAHGQRGMVKVPLMVKSVFTVVPSL